MDDLLREFLTESAEHLDTIDAELVRFERDLRAVPLSLVTRLATVEAERIERLGGR